MKPYLVPVDGVCSVDGEGFIICPDASDVFVEVIWRFEDAFDSAVVTGAVGAVELKVVNGRVAFHGPADIGDGGFFS